MPLGEWVLKAACYEAVDWPDNIKVAVNLSPTQINNRNLLSVVIGALGETRMPARKLQLEITETVLLQTPSPPCGRCMNCASWGCRSRWTTSEPAIHRSVICVAFPLTRSRSTARSFRIYRTAASPVAIVQTVANLAKCLKMDSTAEGVETQQQADILQSMGCTEMQGYLFSQARPAHEIRRYFTRESEKETVSGVA